MLLAPEQTLRDGRYKLERRLGVGGMASVWLARDCRLERPVAIKIISETLAMDHEFVERFRREAQVAAQLSHPNLVRLYDYGTEEERPFLVSEWINGPDLHELRRSRTPVDAEALAADLLSALDYIHRAGVIHRDVKPSNVLIGRDRRARLTDFGIAQPEDATRLTETGRVMGTATYIAPEVMRGERASAQSDLYSAGILLREELDGDSPPKLRRLVNWLTAQEPGARPRTAAEALELVKKVRETPTRRTAATVPLETTPEDEPETAQTVAETLPPEPERPPPAPVPFEFRPEPYRRSRFGARALAVLGAALAIGALVVVVIAIASGGGDDEPAAPQERAAPGGGDGGGGRDGAAPATEAAAAPDATAPAGEPVTAEPPAGVPPPSPNPDEERGIALNDKGKALLDSGQAEAAVPILRRAVASWPAGTSDINYYYALYNYGDALLQAGQAEEAIPVLEARLEHPDQRETVLATLEEARAAADQ
jgi:serine/threonine protein kinase